MDLQLTEHPVMKDFKCYVKGGGKESGDNFALLGFKDNSAVIEPCINQLKNLSRFKILNFPKPLNPANFSFDESGDKFINLNGQKLKVVPQGKIPEEVRKRTMLLKHQMINIGSLKKPLKVRVISSATQLGCAETAKGNPQPDKLQLTTKDKANSILPKLKVISTKVLKPTGDDISVQTDADAHTKQLSVIPKLVSLNSLEPVFESTQQGNSSSDDLDLNLTNTTPNVVKRSRVKLLCRKNLTILNRLKMQALNLSKKKLEYSKIDQSKVSTADVGVQTELCEILNNTINKIKNLSDQTVQTDVQRDCRENISDPFEFDLGTLLDSEDFLLSPVINNVNFGTGPSIGKVQNFSEGGLQTSLGVPVKSLIQSRGAKSLNDGEMQKQLLFFSDLRECLTPNMNGNLPIHDGVINNDIALVRRMCVALKARKAGVNLENNNGCTPLQLAVINNSHVAIVQLLLDAGADIAEVDGEGNNILHLGAKFETLEVLRVILFHPVINKHPNIIDSFNFEGLTPLMICCMSSWTEGVVLLIQHRANVNLKDQTSGRTALFHAAEAMNVEIVRFLLDHRADPKIKNFFGTSPHDAMYELDEMPDKIKNLIFGKTKKRSIEAEMNPCRTAKAAKCLKTFSKLQKIEPKNILMPVSGRIKL